MIKLNDQLSLKKFQNTYYNVCANFEIIVVYDCAYRFNQTHSYNKKIKTRQNNMLTKDMQEQ